MKQRRQLFIYLLIGVCFIASSLRAQSDVSFLHAPKSVVVDEEFNVFLTLRTAPSDTLNALIISLPRAFQTPKLTVLGSSNALSLVRSQPSTQSGRTSHIFQIGDSTLNGKTLCLLLRGSESILSKTERLNVCLASVSRDVDGRVVVHSDLPCDAPSKTTDLQKNLTLSFTPKIRTDNFAAAFDSTSQTSVHLVTPRLSVLSLNRSFTAEIWFRTVSFGGVLLSAWSGSENDGYPLELEVGRDGRLAAFFGTPFSYRKLQSATLNADGVWRHCAVTLDSATGAMHLYLDGVVQDSVRLGIERRNVSTRLLPLYIGSRAGKEKFFHGEIDEVKLYRRAKRPSELIAPEVYDQDDDATLQFSESFSPSQRSLLIGKPVVIRSSLPVSARLKNLRADISGSDVWLSWEFSGQSDMSSFTVERSLNGVQFQSLSTIDYRASQGFYRFFDRNAGELGKVIFYRLRRNAAGRAATYTGAIKIGLAETKTSFRLFQNTPNPFNPSTTINYELTDGATVELYIYNTLGTEVARIKRGFQSAGRYTFFFNAVDYNLSSGIYLYRLQTDFGAETRKMILMK